MDVFHGNWRAPKASRPIITVDATEDAMKQLLAAFGIPSLDFAVSYAFHETTTREAVRIQRELSSQNAARLRRMIRDIDEEVRPAGVIVSPWPGITAGAGVSALGNRTRVPPSIPIQRLGQQCARFLPFCSHFCSRDIPKHPVYVSGCLP